MSTRTRAATTLLALLEQELTLLARHQLSSSHHTPDLGLDRSGYQLLSRLELGPLSLGGLAEAFKLDVSTVNRQIAALRRKDLVERIPDPAGGVAKLLRPTRRGLSLLRQDREVRHGHLQTVIADWDAEDVLRLQELLAQFNTSIEVLEGRPWPRS
ncbi:MarR family winged helix-turn-helix transcriptional regulator [Marmoricola sp. RAF53]|uniref:MarR family winged helix-turn-helix transcriptional regulator n=1 Tax=Marmoricola sp. RAF53 TaxID=3233059 RepID=UPI003F9E262F